MWLYSRFPLSHRDSGNLLAERGVHTSRRPRRHLLSAQHSRQINTERVQHWRDAARLAPAA